MTKTSADITKLTPQNKSSGGDEGTRTPGLCLAKAALSQLSYIPYCGVVGLTGFEPVTPALSAQCSNQLSYRPLICLNN